MPSSGQLSHELGGVSESFLSYVALFAFYSFNLIGLLLVYRGF